MSAIATAIVGSAVIGAVGANSAADTQAQAAQNAQNQQQANYNQQNAYLAPYRATGYNSLNTIGSMLPGTYTQYDANGNPIGTNTGSGYLTKQFTNEDLNANLAPNYAFNLEQGQGSVRNLANSAGGLIGGNAIKGIQDYTQNFAGNAYNNAFNQFQTQRGDIYNTLANIAGIGTGTNNTGANLGTNTANSISSLGVGAANASAAGTVGTANAISGGLSSLGNYNYMNQILGQNQTINPYSQLPNYSSSGGSGGSTSIQDMMNSRVA
jgi:hypothetical protein